MSQNFGENNTKLVFLFFSSRGKLTKFYFINYLHLIDDTLDINVQVTSRIPKYLERGSHVHPFAVG